MFVNMSYGGCPPNLGVLKHHKTLLLYHIYLIFGGWNGCVSHSVSDTCSESNDSSQSGHKDELNSKLSNRPQQWDRDDTNMRTRKPNPWYRWLIHHAIAPWWAVAGWRMVKIWNMLGDGEMRPGVIKSGWDELHYSLEFGGRYGSFQTCVVRKWYACIFFPKCSFPEVIVSHIPMGSRGPVAFSIFNSFALQVSSLDYSIQEIHFGCVRRLCIAS